MNSGPDARHDPYELDPHAVQEPPLSVGAIFRKIGPGIILAGAIVGSGELIATTTLGAQVGYAALWVILLSCLIKTVVQAELGRYTIASGETTLSGFSRVPGPRWRVGWVVWAWGLMVCLTLLQVGGMYGGLAQVMCQIYPGLSETVWVIAYVLLTLALLLGGGYGRIEFLSMIMIALFTLTTIASALILTRHPEYFSWRQLGQGLRFRLPGEGLVTAVAVFGITGVGATELFAYPYWCVEKGYARFTGRLGDDPRWTARARGWLRVMHVDICCSLVIYTLATIAFYLLGAGILHGMGLVPKAGDMIAVLTNLYTQTFGGWAKWLFYAGAIATLYSTIFAATAAHARMFADMSRLMGLFEAGDYARRQFFVRCFVLCLVIVPAILYFSVKAPVWMVIAGGWAQSLMLPVIALGTVYLSHRHLPREVAPARATTAALWLTALIITAVVLYSLAVKLREVLPH